MKKHSELSNKTWITSKSDNNTSSKEKHLTHGLDFWMGIYPGKIMLLPSCLIGKPVEVRVTAEQLEQIAFTALKSAIEMRSEQKKLDKTSVSEEKQ